MKSKVVPTTQQWLIDGSSLHERVWKLCTVLSILEAIMKPTGEKVEKRSEDE